MVPPDFKLQSLLIRKVDKWYESIEVFQKSNIFLRILILLVYISALPVLMLLHIIAPNLKVNTYILVEKKLIIYSYNFNLL